MSTRRIVHSRGDLLGQRLAELDAPLVEGIDAPYDALRQHTVLVERDETAEGCRVELPKQHEGEWAAARVHFVSNEGVDLRGVRSLMLEVRTHGFGGLAVAERFGLSEAAGDGQILLRL